MQNSTSTTTPPGELIPKNKPFTFEGLDIRPSFRANDAGAHTYSVNIMVTEEQWNALKTIPRHRLIGGVLYWYDDEQELPHGDPDSAAKPAPEPKPEKDAKYHYEQSDKVDRGPWGSYWQQLFKRGFQNYPDLISVLNCAGDQIRLRLHDVFSTDTLTTVSPDDFERFLEEEGLTSLITLSRQAVAHLQEVRQN
jgi:hypothetical protein